MTWFYFEWTDNDNKLVEQWKRERGKLVNFIDESIPDVDADERAASLPIILEEKSDRRYFSALDITQEMGRSTRTRIRRKSFSKREREAIFDEKHRICAQCGSCDSQTLQIDHIDNNPHNNELYNLQVLCYTCHKLKHKPKIT